jgi:hypothetical protein
MILTPLFVFFFVLVFVLVWLFANTIDKRKWVSFLITLIAAPIFYFYVFYPFINIFFSYHHQKHFETEAWVEKPSLRYEMSDVIIDDHMFQGKTKKDVETVLGKSEWYGWDDAIKANSKDKWNYNLGFKPGAFNMSQECLELVFKNDTVASVYQYQMEKEFE